MQHDIALVILTRVYSSCTRVLLTTVNLGVVFVCTRTHVVGAARVPSSPSPKHMKIANKLCS
jgi:hypothetical protein